MAPTFVGMSSWYYGGVAGALGLVFVGLSIAIYRETGDRFARRTFAFSILYLFLLFAALIADKAFGLAG
jgi:protoheme IX farnesyltransferase